MIFGFFSMILFGIALVLFILTFIFRKRKVAKWTLASLGLLFAFIPFNLIGWLQYEQVQKRKSLYGDYARTTDQHGLVQLKLFDDGTYQIYAEQCSEETVQGRWELFSFEGTDQIYFYPEASQNSKALLALLDKGIQFQEPFEIGNCNFKQLYLVGN